jgi:protein-L-isoaspartate(D-aspartate) O-methyltransferase
MSENTDTFTKARIEMVAEQIRARGINDKRILAAMTKVPRHLFIPKEYINQSYEDHPLPIGQEQTISQPYVVALMTQHLELKAEDKVLEIGTGSGYQTAVLAELTNKVYTIEVNASLSTRAAATLKELGYAVNCKIGDGYYGWLEYAPFDAIIVTCYHDQVPHPLMTQLGDGGRLVIPLGSSRFNQTLVRIWRKGEQFQSANLEGVAFVPMLGQH